jgi:eukaryotic-like serine/threonine-protein kinase
MSSNDRSDQDGLTVDDGSGAKPPVSGGTAPLVYRVATGPSRDDPQHVRLHEVIGAGGMGEVYTAEQLDLGRKVAFKRLFPGATARQRERFAREARLTAQLDHPHIVPVHLMETTRDGLPSGYAMKLVEGKTLRALLTEAAELVEAGKPRDPEHSLPTMLEHFLKICDAVAFSHARGVLHRDLKPPNVMIGKFGEVYVMDWGVARGLRDKGEERYSLVERTIPPPGMPGADLTQAGEVVGSASYMSPEQAEGRNDELDARTDQYSLGLILFEILTLRKAITGESNAEVVLAASQGQKNPFEPVSSAIEIPPELRAIVEKATSFQPAHRYVDVPSLADDVRRYLQGDAVQALPEGPLARVLRWMSKNRRATLAVVLAVIALSGVVAGVTLYQKTASELALRRRGDHITIFYGETSHQAHAIDRELQRMELALEGLRHAAIWALAGPEPAASDAQLFFADDFADATRRPGDFTKDTAYRWPVSTEHPVVGLAPGADKTALLPKIRRLAPLRRHFQTMFTEAAGGAAEPPNEVERRRLLLDRKGPIDYAYVDLAEGVHFVYPGIDALPLGYDVRTSSFYKISERRHGKRWGSPYVDATTDPEGDDLVLPCTEGLWSREGEFLGVVGVEITVTKLVETSLALPKRNTIRTSLLDAEGRKVVDSFDAGKRFRVEGKDEFLKLAAFDIPEIVDAVKAREEGVREIRKGDRDELVAFTRLEVLGWYYVVEVDTKSVTEPRGT